MGVFESNRRVVLVVLAFAVTVMATPGIAAAESRAGGNIVIGPDEVIREDLEVYGGSVVIHGTVDGDVRAYAGNVLIDGEVTGNVEVAAGNVDITGRIGGSLQASAGAVEISDGATIGGDLDVASSSVLVNGAVDGDVRATAEVIVLGSTGSVAGDVVYDGTLRQNPAATVGGTIRPDETVDGGLPVFDGIPRIPGWVFGLYGFVANLLLGAFLLVLFPHFSAQVAHRALVNPVTTSGLGLLTLIGAPILLLVVAVTIIGLPLAVLGVLLYAGLLWVAGVYGRYAIGTWLVTFMEREGRWTAFGVGMIAVGLVVRIPLLGTFLEILVFLLGLGAVTRALVGRYRGRSGGSMAVPSTGEERPTELDG